MGQTVASSKTSTGKTGDTEQEAYVRDALTGEKIPRRVLARSLVMRDRARDTRIEYSPRNDQPIATSDVPISIDSSQPYPQGHLGGKRWTRPFSAYISPVLPNAIAQIEKERKAWWQGTYQRERVRNRFVARYGSLLGERYWTAAYSILRGEGGPDFQDTLLYAAAQTNLTVLDAHRMWSMARRWAMTPSSDLDAHQRRETARSQDRSHARRYTNQGQPSPVVTASATET